MASDRLPTLIDIVRLRLDGGTQHAGRENQDLVDEYTVAYLEGEKLPPVEVVFDNTYFWLWDGFTRVAAAKSAGQRGININCRRGTQRDAFMLSLSANIHHGQRRSAINKTAIVMAALNDEELAQLSSREIAVKCGVSHTFVNGLRDTGEKGETATKDSSGKHFPSPKKEAKTGGSTRKKAKPIGSLETISRERDEWKEQALEGVRRLEMAADEIRVLEQAVKFGDAELALREENTRLRARVASLEESVGGLMDRESAAVKRANYWQGKARAANGSKRV